MSSPSIPIRSEPDIACAREAVRLSAHALAFEQADLRLVLAAVSELCVSALEAGGGELVVSELRREGREGVSIVLKQGRKECGSAEEGAAGNAGLGNAGAQRLVDEYTVSVRGDKTIVHAIQWRRPRQETLPEYGSQLEYAVAHAGEEPLQRAFAFGRRAVLNGLGVLDMVRIHGEAMDRLAHNGSPHFTSRTRECLEEALAAFEMVYRGYPEARKAMRNINELLEQEAARIAHSLHDEAGQTVAALHIGLDELEGECKDAACRQKTSRLKVMVDAAGALFRSLSHELRSPLLESAGLAAALQALCVSLTSRSGLQITFEDELKRRIDGPLEMAVYRTVQVGLANVVRHAHATHAVVSIGASAGAAGRIIVCSVRDDGRGIDAGGVTNAALGLKGVRDRVLALGGTVETAPIRPHGFELRICLPDPDYEEAYSL